MAGLRRDLGILEATSIVVGSMIGSGIFLGVEEIARLVRDPWLVLGVFLASGLLVLLGALTYGELASLFPRSGGTYAWIREAYGPAIGFLQGWSILTIAKSASLAALGVAFATRLGALLPLGPWEAKGVAVGVILLLTLVNVAGVRYAGWVSNVSTFAKVGALAVLVILGLLLVGGTTRTGLPEPAPGGADLFSAFGLGMVFAMFAYDGWANSAQVSEEVKDAPRNVPRSLVLGVVVVMLVYLAVVFVYLLHLGVGGVVTTGFAAAATAESFGGELGRNLLVVAVLVSIAGTANAVILSGPRVTFAMARDGLFWSRIQDLNRAGTPAKSIWLQTAWSVALALTGTFESLLQTVIFSSWIWYGLAAYAVFVFRRRLPDAPRAVRVPLYPLVPAVFLVATALFTVNTLVREPVPSLVGVGIVLAGLPLYFLFWRGGRAGAAGGAPPDGPADAAAEGAGASALARAEGAGASGAVEGAAAPDAPRSLLVGKGAAPRAAARAAPAAGAPGASAAAGGASGAPAAGEAASGAAGGAPASGDPAKKPRRPLPASALAALGAGPPAPPLGAPLRGPGTLDEDALRARLVDAAARRSARGEAWSTEDVARELDADVGAVYAALAGLAGDALDVGYADGRLTVRPRAGPGDHRHP